MSTQHISWRAQKRSPITDDAVRMSNEVNELLRQVERTHWPMRVIEYAKGQGIDTSLNASQLTAAMGQMPYWFQGPANFLDFVRAYAAIAKVTK